MAKGSSAFASLAGSANLAPPPRVLEAMGRLDLAVCVSATGAVGNGTAVDAGTGDGVIGAAKSREAIAKAGDPEVTGAKSKRPLDEVLLEPRARRSLAPDVLGDTPKRSACCAGLAGSSAKPSRSACAAGLEAFVAGAELSAPMSRRSAGGAAGLAGEAAAGVLSSMQGPTTTPATGAGTSRPKVRFLIHASLYQSAAGVE